MIGPEGLRGAQLDRWLREAVAWAERLGTGVIPSKRRS
jgi:hypothetical protein